MQPRTVLGFCPDVSYNNYLFVPVLAEVVDGQLVRLAGPAQAFQPNGTVYIPHSLIPPGFRHHDVGVWEAEEQPDWDKRGLSARYRATRLFEDCPPEVVHIDCAATDTERARRILLETGLPHAARLHGRDVLLEFSDRRVAGPLRFHPPARSSEAGGLTRSLCLEEFLADPLPAWPSRAELGTVPLKYGSGDRVFVVRRHLPAPEGYIDLASVPVAMASLFRYAGIASDRKGVPSRTELQELLRVLREAPAPPAMASRRVRLEGLLQQSIDTGEDLDRWARLLATHPHFKGGGAPLNDAPARELSDRLEKLKEEEAEARRRLEAVQAEAAAAEAPAPAGREPAAAEPAPAAERNRAADALPLGTAEEALAHVEVNLKRLGVAADSARPLAREVVAAASLGQALLFRGSLAGPLAHAVAVSLGGHDWTRLDVPLGLAHGGAVERLARAAGPGSALLLEGVNRSCVEAYGGFLVRLLSERSLGRDGLVPGLLLVGTLLDGPGALPADAGMTSLGAVFDADCLAWSPAAAAAPLVPGRLRVALWPEGKPHPGDLREMLDRVCPIPNERWRRHAAAAWARLGGLVGLAEGGSPAESLLFAWVVPHAAASGADPVGGSDALRELLPDAGRSDRRLAALLRAGGAGVAG